MGDNIFNACQIWLHSVDFDALFHSLDWLQSLDVDYIIPGHGPVKGKECIVENKQFLYAWLAAVGEGIERAGVKRSAWSVSASRTAASWTSASRSAWSTSRPTTSASAMTTSCVRPNCER